MIKIREILSRTSNIILLLFKKFPLTLSITFITTLFLTIFIDFGNIVSKITAFAVIWAIGTLFIEILELKQKKFIIIGYILAGLISLFFVKLPHEIYDGFNEHVIRVMFGYAIILILLTIHFIFKKEKLTFEQYLLKIFNKLFNSTVIYGILNIGLMLITVIFVELILEGSYGDSIMRMQILLLGLFYIPSILNSISNVKEKEESRFITVLLKYVLLPLVAISMIIIYIYIAKILLEKKLPSNIIFRILAGIFIVAFPIWSIAKNFEDNKIIKKVSNILPYAYIPFIFLEIYSLGIRILDFGFTPIRYIGMMFIVFQIIVLILTLLKNKQNSNYTFVIMAGLVFISCMTPLNFNTVSKLSQKYILEKEVKGVTTFDNISSEGKQKVVGAYKYLINNYGKEYIPEHINEMKNEINAYIPTNTLYRDYEYLSFYKNEEVINIADFSELLPVRTNSDDYNDGNIDLYDYNSDYIIKAQIKSIIENALKEHIDGIRNFEDYILQNRTVKIDDNQSLYITSLNITYNTNNNEIKDITLTGYLLKKS